MRLCTIQGCNRTHEALGLCRIHYRRVSIRGTAEKWSPTTCPMWLYENVDFDGDDCLIWPFGRLKNGYACITIRSDTPSGFTTTSASRLMCKFANGDPPNNRYQAAHNCGRGKDGCVNPTHIRWATPKENNADKIAHGTTNKGQRHGMAKLTDEQAAEILSLLKNGMVHRRIAERFDICAATVTNIKNGKSWTHIPRISTDDKYAVSVLAERSELVGDGACLIVIEPA